MLLAGANNSGKTALLSGLDLVVRGAVPPIPRHAAALEPARIRARFALSEEERYQLLQNNDVFATRFPQVLRWVELHFVQTQLEFRTFAGGVERRCGMWRCSVGR